MLVAAADDHRRADRHINAEVSSCCRLTHEAGDSTNGLKTAGLWSTVVH